MTDFFSEASAKGARSTALHALQWALGMLLAAFPVCVYARAPEWVLYLIAAGFGVVTLTFVGAYVYLLLKSPDALRSESYSLSKMAIERGLVGDSLSGLYEPKDLALGKHEVKVIESGVEGRS